MRENMRDRYHQQRQQEEEDYLSYKLLQKKKPGGSGRSSDRRSSSGHHSDCRDDYDNDRDYDDYGSSSYEGQQQQHGRQQHYEQLQQQQLALHQQQEGDGSNGDGCYVYQVLHERVEIRRTPSVSDQSRVGVGYQKGDLVEIDLVLHDDHDNDNDNNNNGPYLRLADHQGWLFEYKKGMQAMKRIDAVQTGLWAFYVDNYPHGLIPLPHPNHTNILHDDNNIEEDDDDDDDINVVKQEQSSHAAVALKPLQKIYCDRRVVHPDTGVCWYRLQQQEGMTNSTSAACWVYDKKIAVVNHVKDMDYMLLQEEQVRTGIFAFIAMCPIAIRTCPSVGEDCRVSKNRYIRVGDIVIVSAVRQSPFPHGNGPFLYLQDGSGWLFVYKHYQQMMKEIRIETGGRWSFRVLNAPAGIAARRHPIDDVRILEPENSYKLLLRNNRNSQGSHQRQVSYPPDSIVTCDRRIVSPVSSGVCFYRVLDENEQEGGRHGRTQQQQQQYKWIFDRRGETMLLEPLSRLDPPTNTGASLHCDASNSMADDATPGWSIDFVRGIAATVPGIKEIGTNETKQSISFQTAINDNLSSIRINVYMMTRTVGTAVERPRKSKAQLFRRDCSVNDLIDVFHNPRVHTGRGYQQKKKSRGVDGVNVPPPPIVRTAEGTGIVVDVEEELRNDLLENDNEIQLLQQKRMQLLKAIKPYDDARQKSAIARQELEQIRQEELSSIQISRQNYYEEDEGMNLRPLQALLQVQQDGMACGGVCSHTSNHQQQEPMFITN